MTDLRALREAAEKATPGPWEVYSEPDVGLPPSLFALYPSGDRVMKFFRQPLEPLSLEDLHFAALANPAAIIALLDRLKEAEEAIKAIDRHNDHPGFFNADIENVIRAHLERHNNE